MKKLITIINFLCLVIIHNHTHAQAGSLDLSFGTNGKVATSLSSTGHSFGTASAIQSDGKILAAGYAYFGSNIDFALTRYKTDGSLDLSFDGDGKVTTDLGDVYDFCYAVAIQSDGKIVLTGSTANFTKIAVVRYNTNGSIDSTFDMDGIVIPTLTTIYTQGYSVAIQSDDKILIAAQSFSGANVDFAVIRLNTNGSLDSTFDTDGIVLADIYGDDLAYAISLQSDGKIVVAGTSGMDFSAVRLNTDGSLDNTFDTDGKVKTHISIADEIATSIAIQSDGKIILAGYTNAAGNVHVLVRYNTNGSLDSTFDSDGIVLSSNVCSVYGVKVQNDGKIIATGTYPVGSSMDFVVVRYNTNGSLDLTFDTDGVVTTDFGFGTDDFAYSTSIQNDSKIVVVGHGYNSSYTNFMVVRYNPDITSSINNLSEPIYNIYPNPTKGVLNIQNQKNDYSIKIINIIGQQVYTENCKANKSLIDVQNLPKGIYILTLQSNSKTYTSRFMKE
ncbi:MAG: T9SS type A sorting domain-containing protein [Bacteroidia bacterium]